MGPRSVAAAQHRGMDDARPRRSADLSGGDAQRFAARRVSSRRDGRAVDHRAHQRRPAANLGRAGTERLPALGALHRARRANRIDAAGRWGRRARTGAGDPRRRARNGRRAGMSVLERGVLEDGRRYAVIEELSTFCLLGLRFWDAVADDQIRDALRVSAWPLPALRPVVDAFRTVSDIYAFQRLPGLHDVEEPPPFAPHTSPPVTRTFVVEVHDLERRFLPVAFQVDLPLAQRGVYRPPMLGSPATSPPGFYLFSAITRQRRPGVAVVSGELATASARRPVPWALVRVAIAGQGERWGLADAAGRFAVQFPLPLLTPGFGPLFASPDGPASPPGPPVADRSWQIALDVFSQRSLLTPLPGTDLPDLAQIFQQAPAAVLLTSASPPLPAAEWTGTLPFAGELVAATEGLGQLLIVSQGSPP